MKTEHRRTTRALALGLTALASTASCTNTSNNARPRPLADAGPDADRRGTPYLWYAGGALNAYSRTQTVASNDDGPAFTVVPDRPVHNCHDLAFDHAGNLWAVPIDGNQILRIPASRLVQLAPAIPDLVITSPALKGPQSLAFDGAGNLWVLSFNGAGLAVATLDRFDDPRALTGQQTLTPSQTIRPGAAEGDAARFSQATAIAFDRDGNLWLAALSNVLRFDRGARAEGAFAPTPSTILATGEAYASLTFAADGALWVTAAAEGSFYALRFLSPGSLEGVASPVPAAKIRLTAPQGTFAGGLGFDAEGGLWIATSNQLIKLAHASQLAGEVSPAPAVVLGQTAFPDLASKLVFRPTAPGVPVFEP